MKEITIVEVPNNWGLFGVLDRTAYEVRIDGEFWTRVCYRATAEGIVARLRSEPWTQK
jgi:hypothetical protein